MDKLIIERPTADRLMHVDRRVEVCDEAGHTIGWFDPVSSRTTSSYECPDSAAELDYIERRKGGRPLKEVLSDLEKLA